MINGMAIITTKAGGIPEVIEDGVNGLLIEAGDVDALAASLRRVYEDRGLLESLSLTAARRAPDFTIEKAAEHAAEMIEQVSAMHR
jgi:glycosyltransferase involved in cell wall biosynthesis